MDLQVKLYIKPEDEIRRFFVDAKTNFAGLQQRVKEIVGRDDLRLFWQDNEGDQVVCGSDEEFRAARQSIDANGLLRLFAKPGKVAAPQDGEEKHVHRRVTCDGCQGIIAGTRYKCLECPDFDLCEACEGKGIHRDHDMLAIRRPRTHEWKKFFGQGYGPRGPRCHGPPFGGPGHMGPGPCGPPPTFGEPEPTGPGPCGPPPSFGPGRCGSGPRGPCGGRRGPFGGPGGFVPPFVRNMMQNLGQTVEMDVDMNRPWPEIITDITKKVQEAVSKAQAGQNQPEQTQPEKEEEGQPKTAEETTVDDAVFATATAVAEAAAAVAEMINETFVMPSGSRTPSEADWTHLHAEAPEGSETTVKPEPPKNEPTVKSEGQETTVQPETPQQQTGNRIEAALKAMEEMGFPNEGNLLRRLLENYNGDIARVLDSIK